jgi:hypothetical protein
VRIENVAAAVAPIGEGPMTIVGEAASQVDWSGLAGPITLRTEPPHDWPRAAAVGRLAMAAEPVRAVDDLEPLYIRPPEITMPKVAPA